MPFPMHAPDTTPLQGPLCMHCRVRPCPTGQRVLSLLPDYEIYRSTIENLVCKDPAHASALGGSSVSTRASVAVPCRTAAAA